MANENYKLTTGKIISSIILTITFPVLFIFLSGNWLWIEGWIFVIWFLAMTLTIGIYLYYKDPALLAERANPETSSQKGWDRYIYSMIMIGFSIWFIIMPLDKRFEWTANFPLWLKIFGGIELILSFFFLFRSVADNTFASTLVKIQKERKQYVVSTGVYAFVRHPMYLGAFLMCTGAPFLLGTIYGLLIGILLFFLVIARIIGEEKMLTEELEGYVDYKKKVRYRLIPFIW